MGRSDRPLTLKISREIVIVKQWQEKYLRQAT